jgi:hypothetical protein
MVPSLLFGRTAAQADSSPNTSDVGAEVKALRDALLRTQQQVAAQQQEIEILKAQSKTGQTATGSTALKSAATEAVSPSPTPPNANPSDLAPEIHNDVAKTSSQSADPQAQQARQTAPPASIKLGDAVLTLGGFVDFENVFRTTNTQSNIATNLAGIPYSNTPQGSVTEFRTTAQYSRVNIKVEDNFRGNKIIGYVEGDFSGNSAPNVYQSVNGLTHRVRLCFGYVKRGKWIIATPREASGPASGGSITVFAGGSLAPASGITGVSRQTSVAFCATTVMAYNTMAVIVVEKIHLTKLLSSIVPAPLRD